VVYDRIKTLQSGIFSFGILPKINCEKRYFCQELTYQDELRHGKKSEDSRIHVVAETVENQTQETFEDARGEENEPDLSGRIGWFSEFVMGMIVEDFQQ